MNLNKWAECIHANAVEHGWYDKNEERDIQEFAALIHSEWSEALEEKRAGKPDFYHNCKCGTLPCESCECIVKDEGKKELCDDYIAKPEGYAVELIDGAIRIFDLFGYVGKKNQLAPFSDDATIENLIMDVENALNDGVNDNWFEKPVNAVCALHRLTSKAVETGEIVYFVNACAVVFYVVKKLGLDPEEVMKKKHEYNKTRPYKHGKNF